MWANSQRDGHIVRI